MTQVPYLDVNFVLLCVLFIGLKIVVSNLPSALMGSRAFWYLQMIHEEKKHTFLKFIIYEWYADVNITKIDIFRTQT